MAAVVIAWLFVVYNYNSINKRNFDLNGLERIKKMKIKVLGACCKRSTETFENTKAAVKELGLDVGVENIGDCTEIARYGVMSTPAMVIDDKVVSFGKYLNKQDVINIISKVMK